MKNLNKILFGLLGLAILTISCEDNDLSDPLPSIPIVQFESSEGIIKESEGEKIISLNFNKTFDYDATIRISVDTSKVKYFTSTPAPRQGVITIFAKKNDSKAILKLKPVDNSIVNQHRVINFNFSILHNEFVLGEKRSYTLTIEDDDTTSEIKDSYVNFIPAYATLRETEPNGQELQLHVSESATANGSLTIQSNSERAVYGTHYVTEPAFQNNLLTLNASAGNSVLKFKIKPLNDFVIAGNLSILFTVKETSGNLKPGSILMDSVQITDDELSGLPKGYETSGGGWGMKKTYEYNSKGNIARVLWENYTPNVSTGIHTYYYNDVDQLIRVNTDPGHDIKYRWENGKITKQEKVRDGVVRSYSEYGYDDHGNVGSYRTFYLQPDGTFSLSDVTLLLYYPDVNLYKKIVYYPTPNSDEELVEISETTFDSYLDADNPFPMVEVLPNMKTQKKLPSTYRHKANGHDLLYNLSYEFRPDGKVGKRTAIRGTITDIAVYHYY